MILSKKKMILSKSILVIWFEIFSTLHGKVIIQLKIRHTDNSRVNRGSRSVVLWKKAGVNFTYFTPAEYLLPKWKMHYHGVSCAFLQQLIGNVSQWKSCKRLLLKRVPERSLEPEWMKKRRKYPEFSLTMDLHKNHVKLKNHIFYSLQIPWSKKCATERVLSRNDIK